MLLNRKQDFAAEVQDNQRASKRLDLPALLAAERGGLSPADFNEVAKRAHMWAQFGLLTTEERRSQYRELALLMRQGATAAEAVPDTFGMPLDALTEQFASGAWQKDASFRLPPRGAPPEVLPPGPLEGRSSKLSSERSRCASPSFRISSERYSVRSMLTTLPSTIVTSIGSACCWPGNASAR